MTYLGRVMMAHFSNIYILLDSSSTSASFISYSMHPCPIYTTIAALSAKICPQNRTDFYQNGLNSTPIIAYIFLPYMLPIRDLWTASFLRLSFVLKKKKSKRISHRHSCDVRCNLYAAVFPQMSPPPPTKTLCTTSHDYA